jgi:hypothetical protein
MVPTADELRVAFMLPRLTRLKVLVTSALACKCNDGVAAHIGEGGAGGRLQHIRRVIFGKSADQHRERISGRHGDIRVVRGAASRLDSPGGGEKYQRTWT